MEEDYFDEEYDYFDSRVADLKEELKKELKQEIKDKIEKLEKENEELQEIKRNWKEIKNDYERKIAQVETEKEEILKNAKQEIYNATLKDLFDNCNFFEKIYKVDDSYVERPKCNMCDEDRKLTVTDCYGREHKVDCKCKRSKYKYFAIENLETGIYVQKDSKENNFAFKIKDNSDCSYSTKIEKENVLEKFDKDKVKGIYNTYFTTIEEAQKYADYLNSIED